MNQALRDELGPLPIRGRAFSSGLRFASLGLLAVMLFQVLRTVGELPLDRIDPVMAGVTAFCVIGLLIVVWFMQTSVTTIDDWGIRQTWVMTREVPWEELHTARFMPLLMGKRLMVLSTKGRYIVFQAGEPALERAFAQIAVHHPKR